MEAVCLRTSAACTQCWAGRIPAAALGLGEPSVGDEGPDPCLPAGDEGPDPSLPTGEAASLGDEGPDPVLSFPAIVLMRRNRIYFQCSSEMKVHWWSAARHKIADWAVPGLESLSVGGKRRKGDAHAVGHVGGGGGKHASARTNTVAKRSTDATSVAYITATLDGLNPAGLRAGRLRKRQLVQRNMSEGTTSWRQCTATSNWPFQAEH